MNLVRHLSTTVLAVALASAGNGGEAWAQSKQLEQPAVDKIVQLTAQDHSTILFTLGGYRIGYSRSGRVQWIVPNDKPGLRECSWPHPALSHDGLRVAFVTASDDTKHCVIRIHDMETGKEDGLLVTNGDPGEISWSWHDQDIVFFDHGFAAVSVQAGIRQAPMPSPLERPSGKNYEHSVWDSMQWLHNDKDLVVTLDTEIPTKEAGTYIQGSDVLLIAQAETRVLDMGSGAAVSPSSDRIVYFGTKGVMSISPAAAEPTVLAKAPSSPLFSKEELFGTPVWSPDGNQLFIGTIVSENGRDKIYLLDVASGRYSRFLSHTSIAIRAWR